MASFVVLFLYVYKPWACHRYAIGMPPGFSALVFRYVVFGSIDDNPVLLEKPGSTWCYGSI